MVQMSENSQEITQIRIFVDKSSFGGDSIGKKTLEFGYEL